MVKTSSLPGSSAHKIEYVLENQSQFRQFKLNLFMPIQLHLLPDKPEVSDKLVFKLSQLVDVYKEPALVTARVVERGQRLWVLDPTALPTEDGRWWEILKKWL